MKMRGLVLLAAYNGESFIAQQLQTILNQTHKPDMILINIDPSTDKTVAITEEYARKFSEIKILSTNKRFGSAAANFFDLISNTDLSDIDYIALADQDDLWNHDKLEKAIKKLEQGYDGYSSNVEAFWTHGKRKVLVKNQRQQKFDYLFESAGPGCTFVMTKNLATELQSFLKNNQGETSQMRQYHDWLIYAFARTSHYKWFIDSYVGMQYRQHELNDFGAHVGFSGFYVRLKRVLLGEGFDQVLRLVRMLKLEKNPFVQKWYPLSRFGFLRLALHSPYCRRRFREKIYFFFACILLAIIFPKKLCTN
jgi:rhamnosyltransferase